MGRGRQGPPLALALALALPLALAGCLGGPDEDALAVDLPSQDQAPQHAGGDGGHDDSDTWQTDPEETPTPGGDPYGNESDPAGKGGQEEGEERGAGEGDEEDGSSLQPYYGPPLVSLQVKNGTGEPTMAAVAMAPFETRFYLDAKVAGNAIPYWTLRFSGSTQILAEGHDLPAVVEHTLLKDGEHTLVFSVHDGSNWEQERARIHVLPAPPPPPIVFHGTTTGLWAPSQGYLGEVSAHSFTLDVPVRTIQVNLTQGQTAFDLDMELVAPDGSSVDRRVNFNEPTGLVLPPGEPPILVTDTRFTHQLGEWTVYVMPGLSIAGDYEIRISFT